MEESNLMTQGLELMLFGMGFVVVFLVLLIFSTTLMSYLVNRFLPEVETPQAEFGNAAPAASAGGDTELIAVISAGVHRYRQHRRNRE